MSRIHISELRPVGSELFQDAETFLSELTEAEISAIAGGIVVSQATQTQGFRMLNGGDLPGARANALAIDGNAGDLDFARFRQSLTRFQALLKQYSFAGF